ncbi:MAG: glycosyltransferase [Gemmatimonadota bacterium]
MVPPEQTALIRGSGVDLVRFRPVARERDVPVLLYAGRMLWSKGIGEIVEAARLLRRANVPFRLELAGDPDEANPESIPEDTLRRWEEEGIVRWRGQKDDMAAVLSSADVVVLASRREGVPKILLEAAGAGLPIVATDVPGCREVVEHERNGLLVPLDNREALAEALGRLLTDVALRRRMGDASRRKAEAEFDERRVVTETLALYRRFIPPVGEHA